MGDFSHEWLALREDADARARSATLVDRLGDWLARERRTACGPGAPLTILDLGCGTGANLRYLAPYLSRCGLPRQRWVCLDRDADLLAALAPRTAGWAPGLGLTPAPAPAGLRLLGPDADWGVATQVFDLARGADALPIDTADLVTASALLDLVSEAWLAGLLRACVRARLPLLLALTYDGRVAIEPGHALDAVVIGLVNAHQRRDKGLGLALGPGAAERLARLAAEMGLSLTLARSDWRLGRGEGAVQRSLTEGWAAAALEQAGSPAATGGQALTAAIARWHDRRRTEIAAGRSRVRVGHHDALLLPR